MSVDRPQGLVEGSGRRGASRRLDQMISARLDPALVAALKQLAEARGMSFSDVIREAAILLLAREEQKSVITFKVDVTVERAGGVSRRSYDQDIAASAAYSGPGGADGILVTVA